METAAVEQFCRAISQPSCGIVALNVNHNSLCGSALRALMKCVEECGIRLKTILWYFNDWDEASKESVRFINRSV